MGKKKSAAKTNGQALVIVESPAKAKTIAKYLGPGFRVEASIGHVRDLPQGAAQIPAKYKGEKWANLGVNVNDNFKPIYVVPPGKAKHVKMLKDELAKSDALYLATDEDREGEAISWHLLELLKPKVPVHRLVFHEITKDAIQAAMENPRDVDEGLVRAQETRRILDRLFGYEVSPLLWRKVRPRLSAGRVQSVAVRLIVQRERDRMAFVTGSWWDLIGQFAKESGPKLEAPLMSVEGRKIPTGKDFDSTNGKLKNPDQLMHLDESAARALAERIRTGEFRVASIEDKPYTTKPYPPFTTSTLQQECNRKLGFTARRAMQVAQSLYENGHITYMRTDSTNLAKVAIEDARKLVDANYGPDYLPAEPRTYKSKVKNAQEAHEAIRPAGHPFQLPEVMKTKLNNDEFRLFDLIWKRTIASQMADSRGRRIVVTIEGEGCIFQISGKTIDFPGYLRAYVEGSDDPNAELADQEKTLPNLEVGELLTCTELNAKEHSTQPPGRFSEASLTKGLEERGIGRPSTYASIIDTILARNYVFKKGGALVPTWVAFSVITLLEENLGGLVDYAFTAQMEDDLDAISRGERGHIEYLDNFYFGKDAPGLKKQLENKIDEIDPAKISRIFIGKPDDGPDVFVRVGRYSPYVEQGDRTASLKDETPPDEVTLEAALKLLEQAALADEPLGICPDTKKPVYMKTGRFGPYIQRGDTGGDTDSDEEKPQNAGLLKDMVPENVDFETALKLLSLPRNLGVHPSMPPIPAAKGKDGKVGKEKPDPRTGNDIEAFNGRYGPYVKCGAETRSLPPEISPLDVTVEKAIELLAQPKVRGRNAKKPPLKVYEKPSPITEKEVQILDGRFGPYITDGTTNISVRRGMVVEEITFDEALQLLAEKAAQGPAPKKKKKAAKKKAAKKKAAPKKKAAKKKAAVKKKSVKKKG